MCKTYCFGSQLALAFHACVHCSTAIAPRRFRSAMLPVTAPKYPCPSWCYRGARMQSPTAGPHISSCPSFPQGAAGKHILDNGKAQIQPSPVIGWFLVQTARNISTYLNCRQTNVVWYVYIFPVWYSAAYCGGRGKAIRRAAAKICMFPSEVNAH